MLLALVSVATNFVQTHLMVVRRTRFLCFLKRECYSHTLSAARGGSGTFRDASEPRAVLTEQVSKAEAGPSHDVRNHSLVLFYRRDEISVQTGDEGIRFLLISEKPIEEAVAWHGPIGMNTQEQLRQAFAELQRGTFIKRS